MRQKVVTMVIVMCIFLTMNSPALAAAESTKTNLPTQNQNLIDLSLVLKRLQEEKPDVAFAIINLRSVIQKDSVLDPKTSALIGIGVAVALKDQNAIAGHIKLAKKIGATQDEVISTILSTAPSCGAPAVLEALPIAWEIYK